MKVRYEGAVINDETGEVLARINAYSFASFEEDLYKLSGYDGIHCTKCGSSLLGDEDSICGACSGEEPADY